MPEPSRRPVQLPPATRRTFTGDPLRATTARPQPPRQQRQQEYPPRWVVGEPSAASSSCPGAGEFATRVGGGREPQEQPGFAGADTAWYDVMRLYGDIHRLHAVVEKKDEEYQGLLEKKDEVLREKENTYMKLLAAKDKQFADMNEVHRTELLNLQKSKDEQLERLLDKRDQAHKEDMDRLLHRLSGTQSPPMRPIPAQHQQPAHSSTGPPAPVAAALRAQPATSDMLVAQLQAGGDEAKLALTAVLEATLEVLQALAMATPRKQRKSVKEKCERLESFLDEVESDEFDHRLAACETPELQQLAHTLGAVQALRMGEVGVECLILVDNTLSELSRLLDPVMGASRQLSSTEMNVRERGLQTLSDLPRIVLPESAMAEVVTARLVLEVAMDERKADGERATALLGLFVLGLRNAVAVVDVLVKSQEQACAQIFEEVYEGRVQGREGAELFVNLHACTHLCYEIGTKTSAIAARKSLEHSVVAAMTTCVTASCPKSRYQDLLPFFLECTRDNGDVVVASAACSALMFPAVSKTGRELAGDFLSCDPARVGWRVRQRVVRPGLPADRWCDLAQKLSLESVCVSMGLLLANAPAFLPVIPHDQGVWPELIREAVHQAQVNCQQKLAAQTHFSFFSFYWVGSLLKRAVSNPENHAAIMPCAEALLWASANGFLWAGMNTAANAAAACVTLLGKNEGGLTLTKETADCVLRLLHLFFDNMRTEGWAAEMRLRDPAKKVAPAVQLVVDMVIADVSKYSPPFSCPSLLSLYVGLAPCLNHQVVDSRARVVCNPFSPLAHIDKAFVLEHPYAVDDLVTALLLDESNPRRTQDGADKLQATAAKALENLALSEVGKLSLRAHAGVMKGLRALQKDAMSDAAWQSASAALFELDEAARKKAKEAAKTKLAKRLVDRHTANEGNQDDSSSDEPGNVEHVMLSYSWNHQPVIKRINVALKARGYLVWIDIEKMQGSTVEVMSAAVEEAAVMCYGVSEAYKESANCRLEAQYAYQQQVEMIPLKLEEAYRANGWLGMLLGFALTASWHRGSLSLFNSTHTHRERERERHATDRRK
eukprot:COSAG05_NODE_256_length_12752_cov_5.614795_5_plen_1061_part_00